MDKQETKIQVHKKSFWRFPSEAKVALGTKTKAKEDANFEASQFVVNNGSTLEIRLQDANLEIWIDGKKEIGLAKQYSHNKFSKSKYLSKAFEVTKVLVTGADIITPLLC